MLNQMNFILLEGADLLGTLDNISKRVRKKDETHKRGHLYFTVLYIGREKIKKEKRKKG